MWHGVAALTVGILLAAPAGAAGCGEALKLTIAPPEKADSVARVLKRRLEAIGATPSVATDGAGLRVVLPEGAAESMLTRPARVEFRIVAQAADAPGAVSLARAQGGRESVAPQIILDESHMREFSVREDGDHSMIVFRFDPHAMRNLMAATADAVGGKLAIIVDDVVVADPLIRATVGSPGGEIDAGLSSASAKELVDLLANGRLPAAVSVVAREPACKTP